MGSTTAMLVTVAAGLVTSVLVSFLFTAALSKFVKNSELLKAYFGIDVDLSDNTLSAGEYMPAIRGMVALWLFFALMRVVHHNVDMFYGLALSVMPNEATKMLKLGGL